MIFWIVHSQDETKLDLNVWKQTGIIFVTSKVEEAKESKVLKKDTKIFFSSEDQVSFFPVII